MQPTPHVDTYGFFIEKYPSGSAPPCAEYPPQESKLADRRLTKWRKMLGPGGTHFRVFYKKKPLVVKRRVRKGIPDELRGIAWQHISGGYVTVVCVAVELMKMSPNALDYFSTSTGYGVLSLAMTRT